MGEQILPACHGCVSAVSAMGPAVLPAARWLRTCRIPACRSPACLRRITVLPQPLHRYLPPVLEFWVLPGCLFRYHCTALPFHQISACRCSVLGLFCLGDAILGACTGSAPEVPPACACRSACRHWECSAWVYRSAGCLPGWVLGAPAVLPLGGVPHLPVPATCCLPFLPPGTRAVGYRCRSAFSAACRYCGHLPTVFWATCAIFTCCRLGGSGVPARFWSLGADTCCLD